VAWGRRPVPKSPKPQVVIRARRMGTAWSFLHAPWPQRAVPNPRGWVRVPQLVCHRWYVYRMATGLVGTVFVWSCTIGLRFLEVTVGQYSEIVTFAVALAMTAGVPWFSRRATALVDQVLPARQTLTLFFSDIVGSTERLVDRGDAGWRDDLTAYRTLVRQELQRWGGHEVDTAGDGFFATFPRPDAALWCARAIVRAERNLGIATRVGLHWGACEIGGEAVCGLNVHIAARVMAHSGPGQVLTSESFVAQLADRELALEPLGIHTLKGVPGEWPLFRLT
jgi:class 3 adenylate cyclase